MDKKIFAEMVKEKLGEEINPLFVEKLLEKNSVELLKWVLQNLEDTQSTTSEIIYVARGFENKSKSLDLFLFGLKLLDDRFKFLIFIIQELESRAKAIETKPS